MLSSWYLVLWETLYSFWWILIFFMKPDMLTLCNSLIWILQVEDTGRYTCLASSTAGDDDKEYLVRVHGKLGKISYHLSYTNTYLEAIIDRIQGNSLAYHKICLCIRKYVFCKSDSYVCWSNAFWKYLWTFWLIHFVSAQIIHSSLFKKNHRL